MKKQLVLFLTLSIFITSNAFGYQRDEKKEPKKPPPSEQRDRDRERDNKKPPEKVIEKDKKRPY